MDVDPQPTEAVEEAAVSLQLNLLSVIKSAQLQNGLKHGDYGRYRCGLRLDRCHGFFWHRNQHALTLAVVAGEQQQQNYYLTSNHLHQQHK
jgi:hypothetical protein